VESVSRGTGRITSVIGELYSFVFVVVDAVAVVVLVAVVVGEMVDRMHLAPIPG
jgi:hypothetical protein